MIYIRKVRVEAPGTMNQHITDVQHSPATSGPLTTHSREAIVRFIDGGGVVYTHNDLTRTEARVVTRTGANSRKYITTVADNKETNNLLELPRF